MLCREDISKFVSLITETEMRTKLALGLLDIFMGGIRLYIIYCLFNLTTVLVFSRESML